MIQMESKNGPVSTLIQLLLVAAIASPVSLAGDWPTYRGDCSRSGYTSATLPKKMSLLWEHQSRHAPRPAWSGRDTRMPCDRAYHAVISGGTLFFGSSADGKIYALDVSTGGVRWTFHTDGPVRFAPAIWRDRIFAVSDDGFLYCLAAESGSLIRKLRGGPVRSMVLGNDRMVSRWPARGGPAIADGIVYFGAGIWPSEGIFLYAIDASTGETVWRNDTDGTRYMPQPHPGANARSGLSAQGYLVIAGDRVLVPTGRAVPAALSRNDGKLLYFHLQKYGKYGGAQIVGAGRHFLNRGCLFDTANGGYLQARLDPAAIAVTPEHIVYATPTEIAGVSRERVLTRKETVGRKGEKTTKTVLSAPAWKMASPYKVTDSLIVAGGAVVVGSAGKVSAFDMVSQQELLAADIEGVPHGLAAAGGRLFVSTDAGVIYCFGATEAGAPRTRRAAEPTGTHSGTSDAIADEVIRRTGVTQGYCLDLSCGHGALAYALAKRTKLRIYGIEPDLEKVSRARRRLDAAGLYGVRVTVHHGDPGNTAYPNSFANLIVSGRSAVEGLAVVPVAEMNRLLRPYGGVACIGKPGAMKLTVRGALDGAGTWTHQYCDPASTNCSKDTLVRGPLGILWFTDFDFQMPSRHGRGPAPLFLDGRLFVEGVNGLRCVDAYNGRSLWEFPLPDILKEYDQDHIMGAAGTGSNVCMTPASVYVRTAGKCLRIDPATGRQLGELSAPKLPDGKPGTWGYLACAGGTVFGTLSNTEHIVEYRYRRSEMGTQFTESVLLFALDAATGELKWQYQPELSIRNNSIAVGGGRVYLIDRALPLFDRLDPESNRPKGRRDTKPFPTGTLVALDATTGKLAWKATENIYGTMLALSEEHDVLLMSYQDTRFKLRSELGGRMAAFRASDGKRLWDMEARYGSRPILNGRTMYAQPGAWDLLTGEPKDFQFRRAYGCGTLAGSKHLMVYRSGTLGYTDLLHNHGTENYGGVRPGCWINAIPVGGLVLMPDGSDRCRCSYLIKSSIALQPYGVRPPAISPSGAIYPKPVTVTLSADAKDTQTHYTLDGTTPTRTSPHYTEPIQIRKRATLKARAFQKGMPPSTIETAAFVVDPTIIALAGAAWETHDTPDASSPASKWQVADGIATEVSNICKGDAKNPDPALERLGTLRMYKPGVPFADGELSLEVACADNDSLGVAFRCQAPNRYYVWAMDAQRGFRILARKVGAAYELLAKNSGGYKSNRWYAVRIVLNGSAMEIHVDGQKDLFASDETFRTGTFALYVWGCRGAKFRNVRWKPRPAGASSK